MEDEIIQKIYKLTSELASQQQNNQELATSLTGQLSDLKVGTFVIEINTLFIIFIYKQKAATKYTKDGTVKREITRNVYTDFVIGFRARCLYPGTSPARSKR